MILYCRAILYIFTMAKNYALCQRCYNLPIHDKILPRFLRSDFLSKCFDIMFAESVTIYDVNFASIPQFKNFD